VGANFKKEKIQLLNILTLFLRQVMERVKRRILLPRESKASFGIYDAMQEVDIIVS
jgi:hypothetical protein